MLALSMYRAALCPTCKGDLAETTRPEHEDKYEPDLPVTCHRCVGFTRSYKTYEDHPMPQTLVHRVKPPKHLRH